MIRPWFRQAAVPWKTTATQTRASGENRVSTKPGVLHSVPMLAGAAVLLAGGTAGLFVAAHRAHALSRWLSRRPHRSHAIARLAGAVAGWSRPRAGLGSAARVLAWTGTGLLADAGVLTACFGLAGLRMPWG